MTVLSAGEVPAGPYDSCVVGAGPVGLAFAVEAAEAASRVLLVDAGDLRSGRRNVKPNPRQRTEIADLARHAPLEVTTQQGIGGTSWPWDGRCVAFEPIDFEERDYVPDSARPIRIDDVAPWYRAIARNEREGLLA
jgi:choline dehydrogenase-like flavoprotein